MSGSTEASPIRGLSRRDFLKYCGYLAAVIGLDASAATRVAAAIEAATKTPVVVWSQFQECTGCTVSLLQSTAPTPAQLILQQISLAYLETAMATAGAYNEQGENYAELNLAEAFKVGTIWVVEGSIATKIPYAMAIAGRTSEEIAKELYPRAKATVAIGSCACFGNIQAAKPDPTGSLGLRDYLRGKGGIPDAEVVNVARCPGNGEDLVAVLTYILVNGALPELDEQGRPLFLYGQTIHDNCQRRGHYEAGEFVEVYGDEGSAKGWCLFKIGCKGPVTHAPCATTRWNGKISWCNDAGGPCMGCSEDNFWDDFQPYSAPPPNWSVPGLWGVTPTEIGVGLVGATAVGLGVHAVAQVTTGRAFKGGPVVDDDAADSPTGEEKGGDA